MLSKTDWWKGGLGILLMSLRGGGGSKEETRSHLRVGANATSHSSPGRLVNVLSFLFSSYSFSHGLV